jgi:hypothetical protein
MSDLFTLADQHLHSVCKVGVLFLHVLAFIRVWSHPAWHPPCERR